MQCRPLAALAALVVSIAPAASGAGLAITNYKLVSSAPVTLTKYNVTYRADLVNPGDALSPVTATLTSLNPSSFTVVSGHGTLNFGPVAANSQTTSTNTFTILVDRTVPFKQDFSDLQWTFQTAGIPPVANAGPNQTVNVGATVTLNGAASTNPSGKGTLSYSWAFAGKPSGSAATLSGPTTVNPQFVADVAGDYVIGLTVTNGTDSSSASVTVSTIHTPPVANAGPNQTLRVGSTAILNAGGSSSASGSPLTFRWTLISVPPGSSATLKGANTITPSFVVDTFGDYTAQLIVNDGITDSLPATVTVSTSHTAPVANAGPNQTVNVGSRVQLNGAGSTDVDGNLLSYSWTLLHSPTGSKAVLSDQGAVNPSFVADMPGTYVAQLTVSDPYMTSTPSTVTLTSNSNVVAADVAPPTANAGPNQTVAHGSVVQLSGSGTDPQGLPLTYRWSLSKPAGSAASLSNPNIATPQFLADVPGQYLAQLIVNNGTYDSSPSTVVITTTNSPPVANAGKNQTVQPGATVTLDGSGSSDPDKDPITYSWSFNSKPANSAAVLNGANTVSPTFVADLPGLYVVQLIVSDPYTSSNPSTVTITAGGISVTPNPLNLTTAAPGSLTVSIPFAESSDLTVTLSNFNQNVVSVPATVVIPAGSTNANVPVTPVGAGSTGLLATADGLEPGSTSIVVSQATLSISPSPSVTVALAHTASGTVTLSVPAPQGGVTVTLMSSDTTLATVAPSTIAIAQGGTTGSFTITGVALTSSSNPTITASAPGYSSASTSVGVVPAGKIILPASASVAPGQSVPYSVKLASPAPVGGATIQLSSDSSNATVTPNSVFIAAGATTPTTQPMLNGISIGTANITATSPGFFGDTEPVSVTVTLTFQNSSLTLIGAAQQNLVLNISSPVSSPLQVNLVSSDPTVATVPGSVTIQSGSSVNVPVNGLGTKNGTTTITASASGAASATALVTDLVLGPIVLPQNTTVSLGQSVPFNISLPAALTQDESIGLGTSDPTTATISPNAVTVPAGNTKPTTVPSITGVAVGSTSVNVSAAGFGTSSATVNVTATLNFSSSNISVSGGATQNVTLTLSATTPKAITLNLSSDNPAVATVPATVMIPAGSNSVSVPVTGISGPGGSTTIHASALPYIADTTLGVTVSAAPVLGTISVPPALSLVPNQSSALQVSVAPAPTNTASVTLVSDNPSVATVTSPAGIAGGATSPVVQPSVTGVNFGTANITASAQGYVSANSVVSVGASLSFPSGTISVSTGATQSIPLTLSNAAGPAGLVVNLSSSNSGIATVPATVTFPPNASSVLVPVTGIAGGAATITATSTVPTVSGATASVNVANGIILPANVTVQPGGVTAFPVSLGQPAQTQTFITLISSDPSKVALQSNGSGIVSFVIQAGQTTPTFSPRVFGVDYGTVTITATASDPSLSSVTQTVQSVGQLGFYPNPLSISPGATKNINLSLSAASPTGVTVTLSSDNPNFATVPPSVVFGPNVQRLVIPVTGVATGSTLIHASALPYIPDTTSTIIVGNPGPPVITTTSLPDGQVGQPYSATLATTGGIVPFTWTLVGGVLPNGLTLDPSSGVISGTPTVTASSTPLTFQVTDSASPTPQSATATLTLTINFQGALFITSSSLPNATQGSPYKATITAAGGTKPYTFSLVPGTTLPPGLTLDPSGVISGTPTTIVTNAPISVQVTDTSSPQQTAQKTLSLTVGSSVLAITTASLPDSVFNVQTGVGQPYRQQLQASGGTPPYTWSLAPTSGILPPNFFLDPSGVISSSGPITLGQVLYGMIFQVNDASNQTATKFLTITITDGSLHLTTTSLPTGLVGVPYSATLAASGGTAPFSWAITAGVLPSGLSLDPASGTISGTPTTATSPTGTRLKFVVTDSSKPAQTDLAFLSLVINSGPLSISTTSLANGATATPYSSTVTAAGGTPPYTFSATGLPANLSINAATGVISGTPTTAGTFNNVVVSVTDASNPSATVTKTFSITITGALRITTSQLPAGTAGGSYSATVSATGGSGSYTWSATGLPANLTINPSSGVITGTPNSAGTFNNIVVNVTDSSNPPLSASATFSLVINSAPVINTTSLPDGVAGTPYSASLSASGGTGALSFSASGLPANLTISSSGAISGTPASAGTSSVIFTVSDSSNPPQSASKTLSLRIAQKLTIATSSPLPDGLVGVPYSAPAISATGGTGTYTWSATGLPANLVINPSTGLITGTPTTQGSSNNVVVSVTDSGTPPQTASKTFSITVDMKLAISTASPLPDGVQNTPYSTTVSAAGGTGTLNWSATGLPQNLSINASTGVISGTPSTAGTFGNVVVSVTDSSNPPQSASKTFSLRVAAPLKITSTSPLPDAVAGVSYTAPAIAATGGTGTYSWSATGLPANLTINANSGVITGTPSSSGTANVVVTVTDSGSPAQTASMTFSLRIAPQLKITTASLPNGVVGSPYSTAVSTAGGTGALNFSISGQPSNLTINPSTGAISGTPAAVGTTSNVVVTVTDSGAPPQTASSTYSIVIEPVLKIGTSSLPTGIAGNAYTATLTATGGAAPLSWSALGLPANLTINAAGVISGTPAAAGNSNVTITVADSVQTASTTFPLTIFTPLVITTTSLPNGTVGSVYHQFVAASGNVGTLTWSITGQPTGLSIDPSSGLISGFPSAAGAYTPVVSVNDLGSGQVASKTLPITISPQSGTLVPVTISQTSIGQSLQGPVTLSLPAAVTSTVTLTVSSGSGNVLLLNGGEQGLVTSITVTIEAGFSSVTINDIGVGIGQTTLTASGTVGNTTYSGQNTINVTPSGFILTAPQPFNVNQGASANVAVTVAQLDNSGNVIATNLSLAPGTTATVPLSTSDSSVGTLPSSVIFHAGDNTQTVSFTATSSNPCRTTQASVILTAGVPLSSAFALPAGNANQATASINPCGCTLPPVTVGKNLETNVDNNGNGVHISLVGTAASGQAVITSNDTSRFLLGTTPTDPGASQITLNLSGTRSADFYIIGVGTGTAGTIANAYTANTGAFGICSNSVTLAPSGFVFSASGTPPLNPFSTGENMTSNLTIVPAALNSSLGFLAVQPVAAAAGTVSVNVSSGDSSIGMLGNPPSASTNVTFTAGQASAGTTFRSGSKAGNVTLTVNAPSAPSGFSSPSNDATVKVSVQAAVINVCGDVQSGGAVQVGYHLELACTVNVSLPLANDLTLTLTSQSSSLLLSTSPASVGQSSIQVTIPAGSLSSNSYYLQGNACPVINSSQGMCAGANAVNTTYTVAGGSFSDTGNVVITPSGVKFNLGGFFFSVNLNEGPINDSRTSISLCQLDPNTSAQNCNQSLAPIPGDSGPLTLAIGSSSTSVGTVNSPALPAGSSGTSATFTPVAIGSTVLSITPPPNFGTTGRESVTANVTNQ